MSIRKVVIALSVLASTTSLGVSAQEPVVEIARTITADDRGKTISIQAGKTLAVKLPSPAGYSWELTWDSGGFVEPREALKESGGGAGRRVGGGTTTYFLNSSYPGSHLISLVKFGPSGVKGDQFTITINVKK